MGWHEPQKKGGQYVKIKCKCGKAWHVSVHAVIPEDGYICPHCTSRAREGDDEK